MKVGQDFCATLIHAFSLKFDRTHIIDPAGAPMALLRNFCDSKGADMEGIEA